MTRLLRNSALRLGALLLLLLVSTVGPAFANDRARSVASSGTPALPCRDGGPGCIHIGFTDAWFAGQTVQLGFSHNFFCANPPSAIALSRCEAGQPALIPPPSGPVVSNVYLLIPVGFSPPPDTLHCPMPGSCIDHPRTIDLTRSIGFRGINAILPAHSLVIEDEEAFQSTWWPVVLVGVKTLDAWNTIAAAKSIEAVDACQMNGGCFQETDTNAFLFFQVLGPNMSPQGPP